VDGFGTTVSQYIIEQQHRFPDASGEFTDIMNQIVLAAKLVSREVNKAGLVEILGFTGEQNVQGEKVRKLDELANDMFIRALSTHCHVSIIASEEEDDVVHLPLDKNRPGKYAVALDPLDGSSNIDANVSIGTIFSVHRCLSPDGKGDRLDLLQPGSQQVAAGYILYGSSTMLVYTTGVTVNGFTLDPSVGAFLLSNENLRIPERGKYYSVNEGNAQYWDEGTRKWVEWLKEKDPDSGRPYSLRYIGSLVADFHRTLLYGGVFAYPLDYKRPDDPRGKLRLLYEASPLALVCKVAGGRATDGQRDILDIQPEALHQRVPLFIGSPAEVETALRFISAVKA
jgi:fructose-1,6-bisphosphatase I